MRSGRARSLVVPIAVVVVALPGCGPESGSSAGAGLPSGTASGSGLALGAARARGSGTGIGSGSGTSVTSPAADGSPCDAPPWTRLALTTDVPAEVPYLSLLKVCTDGTGRLGIENASDGVFTLTTTESAPYSRTDEPMAAESFRRTAEAGRRTDGRSRSSPRAMCNCNSIQPSVWAGPP